MLREARRAEGKGKGNFLSQIFVAILYSIYIYSKCLSIVLAESRETRRGDGGGLRFQSVLWPHVLYNYRG